MKKEQGASLLESLLAIGLLSILLITLLNQLLQLYSMQRLIKEQFYSVMLLQAETSSKPITLPKQLEAIFQQVLIGYKLYYDQNDTEVYWLKGQRHSTLLRVSERHER